MTVRSQVELIHKQLQESTKEKFGRELDPEEVKAALFRLRDERLTSHINERIGHLDVERILAYLSYVTEPVESKDVEKGKQEKRSRRKGRPRKTKAS